MRKYLLNVNGFDVEARLTERDANSAVDPLIENMQTIRQQKGSRAIVFLAGMPGAGKSTLALIAEKRAAEAGCPWKIQTLGLDGFHYAAAELSYAYREIGGSIVCLADVKGRPETFDAEKFALYVRDLSENKEVFWPTYDRRAHDVCGASMQVTGDILIVEGNWLLLKSPEWSRAREFADMTVCLKTSAEKVKPRLIERKMRGGKTYEEAVRWFDRVDGPNCELFERESVKADFEITLNA